MCSSEVWLYGHWDVVVCMRHVILMPMRPRFSALSIDYSNQMECLKIRLTSCHFIWVGLQVLGINLDPDLDQCLVVG